MSGQRPPRGGDNLSPVEAALIVVSITAMVVIVVMALGSFSPAGS